MLANPVDAALSRRAWLRAALAIPALIALTGRALAQSASQPFDKWVAAFRPRALARGISAQTYDRVMTGVKPDTSVYAADRAQPEFRESMWQYIYRRVSDWRIIAGREQAKLHGDLLARIERDYGVAPEILLGLWGMESAFGDPVVQKNHMRPVIPALAALAWGEPRRRAYWEKELLNALVIIDRGWSNPEEMRGSWAGAMGHTQWMPEVWLNIGLDYDHDGRTSPFGRPDDALAGTARYLVERGKYRRGEHWGCEVRLPAAFKSGDAARKYSAWKALGVGRADGQAFAEPDVAVRFWLPVPGGPAFLIGQNFYAVRSYNPAMSYTLAICHLGDRIMGGNPFVQRFPGAEERIPTLAEVQEIQKRLTAAGFDTGGTDGRVGSDTMRAIGAYQRKVGMQPADGYAGLKLLARLREGP
jgi:lytic murein transglycosylase